MSVAPAVLTAPILTTREAQPVVLVSSEEILTVRTPAYSKSKSDISFLVRQPSGSAICSSYVELLLTVRFTLSHGATVRKTIRGSAAGMANNQKYRFSNTNAAGATHDNQTAAANANVSDYGFAPELLPIQNKCIRNAVITINGSSQSMRVNEFGKEYNLLHMNRKYANKIGGGINDYNEQTVYSKSRMACGGQSLSGHFAPGGVLSAVRNNALTTAGEAAIEAYGQFGARYTDSKQRQQQVDK